MRRAGLLRNKETVPQIRLEIGVESMASRGSKKSKGLSKRPSSGGDRRGHMPAQENKEKGKPKQVPGASTARRRQGWGQPGSRSLPGKPTGEPGARKGGTAGVAGVKGVTRKAGAGSVGNKGGIGSGAALAKVGAVLYRSLDRALDVRPYLIGGAPTVVIVSPFFRGLFFPIERLVVLLISLAIFVLYEVLVLARGKEASEKKLLNGPMDWAVLGLACAYALSCLVAVNIRQAIGETLKYVNYFILFYLVSEIGRRSGVLFGYGKRGGTRVFVSVAGLLQALLAGAVGVAVLGVGAAAGTFIYKGAYEGGRISSSIQYPNSLAAYLTAAFFVGLGLMMAEKAPPKRAIYGAASYLLLLPFIFTYSRGAYLVFPVALAIFLVLSPRGKRWSALAGFLAAAFAAAVITPFFYKALNPGKGVPVSEIRVWVSYLAGVPIAVGLTYLAHVFSGWPSRRQFVAGSAGVAAVAAIAFGVFFLAPEVLPAPLVARIGSISLAQSSALDRILWTLDALKIVADRPILGAGGGGWKSLYLGYQSWGYWSSEVHNYFAQTWVETGTLGLGVLACIWILFLGGLRRSLKAFGAADVPVETRFLAVAVGSSAIALGTHSFIDFNLSLAGIGFYLWSLFGIGNALWGEAGVIKEVAGVAQSGAETGLGPGSKSGSKSSPRSSLTGTRKEVMGTAGVIAVTISVGLLILGGMLLKGDTLGETAIRDVKRGKVNQAVETFKRVITLDPWEGSYRIDYGNALVAVALTKQDPEALGEAKKQMERGVALEPYNPVFRTAYGSLLLRSGDIEGGLKEIEKAVDLQPYSEARYENLAGAYVAVGDNFAKEGKPDEAKKYFEKVMSIPQRMKEQRDKIPEGVPDSEKLKEMTPKLALSLGEAQAFLGRYQEASEALEKASASGNANVKFEANLWLAAITRVSGGGADKAEEYKKRALDANPDAAKSGSTDADAVIEEIVNRLKSMKGEAQPEG